MTDAERRRADTGATESGESGFLGRWSRRKQEARNPAPAEPAPSPEPPAEVEPAALLRDEDMPPLESIDESRDVSPFLSEGVSEGLRRRALRRLFSLPGFNIRDGLDDYDEDYRSFAALGDIVTSDMKFDRERLERLAAERREGQAHDAAEPRAAQAQTGTSTAEQSEPSPGPAPEADDSEETV